MVDKISLTDDKNELVKYARNVVILRNVPYYIMLICVYGKEDVVRSLLKFMDIIPFKHSNLYKSLNYQLCEYVLGCANVGRNNISANSAHMNNTNNLVNLFRIIYLSLDKFEQKFTNNESIINFLSKIIINYIDKGYCYVWYSNKIEKYSIKCENDPIKLIKTYHIQEYDNKNLIIKGFEEPIPIKNFIKKPRVKSSRNNDYQRYSVFYNYVDSVISDKDGKYCPVCNPFVKREINKKTKKEKVSKACSKCSAIFNKINAYFKDEKTLKRFHDNLTKIPRNVNSKKELYTKRLETFNKTLKRELIRNEKITKNYNEITDEDIKSISEKILDIKKEFEKRFTIED